MMNYKLTPLNRVLLLIMIITALARETSAQKVETYTNADTITANGEPIHIIADEPPQFAGGQKELTEYLENNTNYPPKLRKKGIEGKVFITCVIDPTGKVIEVKLIQGFDDLANEEAVRVVKAMPDWVPGKISGKPVFVRYNFPINFSLNSSK